MTDEVNEKVASEQPVQKVVEDSSVTNEATEPEKEVNEDKTFTQDQVDGFMAKTRTITERRVRQQLEGKAQATAPVQNVGNQTQDGYVNDPFLGQIPANTSMDDYKQMLMSAAQGETQPTQQTQTYQAPVNQAPNKPANQLSQGTLSQLDDCIIHNEDAERIMSQAPVTPVMAEAVATDTKGIDNLYRLQKENPQRVFEISRMSQMKQAEAMWQLNKDMEVRRQKKIKSNATPQPAPLDEGESAIHKSYAELSWHEKEAVRRKRGR